MRVSCVWVEIGRHAHVDDHGEKTGVELLMELLRAEGRIAAEDRWAERKQHVPLPVGLAEPILNIKNSSRAQFPL